MLDLVPFLHSHQGISVDELAAEFKIERKELLQDLQALWMCGIQLVVSPWVALSIFIMVVKRFCSVSRFMQNVRTLWVFHCEFEP